jgi:splicing factor U2AF subunit
MCQPAPSLSPLSPIETQEELYQFFAGLMASAGAAIDGGPCISSCKITPDKGYAFLELRTAEEASNAMAFDGVKFRDTNLKVRLDR